LKKENYNCSNIILTGFTNAGKSTLLNCIFKKKVSIVSSKVQTTKDKISGILNIKNTQLIFTDTPGLTNNQKFFDKNISRTLLHEEKKIDFNLFILDISKVINLETINKILKVVDLFENNYLVLNKIDLIKKNNLLAASKLINSKIKFLGTFMISAKKKKGIKYLIDQLSLSAPRKSWKYNKNIKIDKSINFQVSEITREKIFQLLNKEIPYLIKIKTKLEEKQKLVKIFQEIIVSKDSQKSIIIGKNAEKIKMIGTRSRVDIEKLFKKKVFLDLIVKKKKD
tara:strand:- start:961 stop:1806 length:846 start_codon:yes stop_codon:yes gene_type:complete